MALKERIVHTTIGQAVRGVLLYSNRLNRVVLTDQGPERLDVRFQLYDGIGRLYIHKSYVVALGTQTIIEGMTDENGWTELVDIAGYEKGQLSYAGISCALKLSPDEPDNLSCHKSALNALGYEAGPLDGSAGAQFENAVKRFQKNHGLQETGKMDGTTEGKLKEHHYFSIESEE